MDNRLAFTKKYHICKVILRSRGRWRCWYLEEYVAGKGERANKQSVDNIKVEFLSVLLTKTVMEKIRPYIEKWNLAQERKSELLFCTFIRIPLKYTYFQFNFQVCKIMVSRLSDVLLEQPCLQFWWKKLPVFKKVLKKVYLSFPPPAEYHRRQNIPMR